MIFRTMKEKMIAKISLVYSSNEKLIILRGTMGKLVEQIIKEKKHTHIKIK